MTFTRLFPSRHPSSGSPTYFAEKILNNIKSQGIDTIVAESSFHLNLLDNYSTSVGSKGHTIRSGRDWQKNEFINPHFWENMPEQSKLVHLPIKLLICSTWEIRCTNSSQIYINGREIEQTEMIQLAANDGLELDELLSWIIPADNDSPDFVGQIICWDPQINY